MNKSLICLLLFAGIFFTSCVPTRNLTYLQDKSNNNSKPQPISAVALKPYRLQTNDIISITIKAIDPKLVEIFTSTSNSGASVSDEQLYYNGYTVDDHGNIRIPVLGEVNILGLTMEEARHKIEKQLLDEYFTAEAAIFVNVKLAGFRYTINGEVGSPGSQILMQEKVNIMEAIANAGDITVIGDRRSVSVIRQFPHGTEIHNIDLTDVTAMQSPYYYLQPNDYIYVKPLPQKAWGTGTTGLQSFTTIISVLTLVSTTFLLLTR